MPHGGSRRHPSAAPGRTDRPPPRATPPPRAPCFGHACAATDLLLLGGWIETWDRRARGPVHPVRRGGPHLPSPVRSTHASRRPGRTDHPSAEPSSSRRVARPARRAEEPPEHDRDAGEERDRERREMAERRERGAEPGDHRRPQRDEERPPEPVAELRAARASATPTRARRRAGPGRRGSPRAAGAGAPRVPAPNTSLPDGRSAASAAGSTTGAVRTTAIAYAVTKANTT